MTERRGAIFSLGDCGSNDRARFGALGLHPKHLELVLAVFDLTQESEDRVVDIYEVSAQIGIGWQGVRKRAIQLTELGVFHAQEQHEPGRRPRIVYVLQAPPEALPLAKTEHTQLPLEIGGHHLDVLLSDQPRIDDLFCGVLFGSLRYSKRDTRTVVSTTLRWGSESIPVEATAPADPGVAFLTDLRFAIAAMSIIEQIIRDQQRQNREVINRFVLSVTDLLQIVGLASQGGNRQTATSALRRLASTQIRFLSLPEPFRQKFGSAFWGEQSVQLFHGLGIYGTEQPTVGRTPDLFVLSLAEGIFRRLLAASVFTLFSAPKSLLQEKNPTAMAFAFWARRAIGHGDRGTHWWPLRSVQQGVAPQTTLKEFRRVLSELLNARRIVVEQSEEAPLPRGYEFTALLHGYLVTLYSDRIHVRPDPNDAYVGVDSAYAQIRKEVHATLRKPGSDRGRLLPTSTGLKRRKR